MSRPHLRNHDGVINIKGVVIMTTSDYIESALYRQREREMVLRNERHRIALERRAVRPSDRDIQARGGLVVSVRSRLHAFVTGTPVRG
jgi:hypothetical protein